MVVGTETIGWPAASAIASVVLAAVYLMSMLIRTFRQRVKSYDRERHEDDLIRIALFGRPGDPPLEPISGLIADNKETKTAITRLQGNVTTVERQIGELRSDVKELLARTTENGGGSLKDQMNRIENQVTKDA